ncbi:UNVERIFIED_CONTAM: hypothetical protein B566_EDAN019237 [Ephemera danica]|nr:hypothetical protein B566_EDAN019237 [Ephemera danica]
MLLQVKINIVDVNDNKPEFIFEDSAVRKKKYIGAISYDAQVFQEILQVRAEDQDSGKFGQVRYRLPEDQKGAEMFVVEPMTGVLRNNHTLSAWGGARKPYFRFQVEARDDPVNNTIFNSARAEVVVSKHDCYISFKRV